MVLINFRGTGLNVHDVIFHYAERRGSVKVTRRSALSSHASEAMYECWFP